MWRIWLRVSNAKKRKPREPLYMIWPLEVAFWPGPWISHGGPCVYGGGKNPAKNGGNGGGWRKSCQASLAFLLEWGWAVGLVQLFGSENSWTWDSSITVRLQYVPVNLQNLLLGRSSRAIVGNIDPSVMKAMFIGV